MALKSSLFIFWNVYSMWFECNISNLEEKHEIIKLTFIIFQWFSAQMT